MQHDSHRYNTRAFFAITLFMGLVTLSSPSWSDVGDAGAGGDGGEMSGDVASDAPMGGEDAAADVAADVAADTPEDSGMPEDTMVPPEDTAVPPEDTAMPPEDTAAPPEDTAVMPGSGGLTGIYYNNNDFTGETVTRVDGPIEFEWADDTSPLEGIEANNFSVRCTGQIEPLYGELYTLHTISDDGVRLWVDGELLVENWVGQGATETVGTIQLSAGQRYDWVLDYFQGGGPASIQMLWSSSSQVREIIPPSQLEPESGVLRQEPMVGLKALDISAAEASQNTAAFVLWRYGRLDEALTVNLDVAGSATNGEDFVEIPTTLELAPGQSARRYEVTSLDDRDSEGTENIAITVAPGNGYAVAEQAGVDLSLADDEMPGAAPTWSITGTNSYAGERQGPYVVGVYSDAAFGVEVDRQVVFAPGVYSVAGLGEGTYYVSGWLDEDEDGAPSPGELTASWIEGGAPGALAIPGDAFNVDLVFTEPEESEDEGCGCATVHRPGSAPPWGVGLMALMAAFAMVVRLSRR